MLGMRMNVFSAVKCMRVTSFGRAMPCKRRNSNAIIMVTWKLTYARLHAPHFSQEERLRKEKEKKEAEKKKKEEQKAKEKAKAAPPPPVKRAEEPAVVEKPQADRESHEHDIRLIVSHMNMTLG